jgi:hypothetical protein
MGTVVRLPICELLLSRILHLRYIPSHLRIEEFSPGAAALPSRRMSVLGYIVLLNGQAAISWWRISPAPPCTRLVYCFQPFALNRVVGRKFQVNTGLTV